jgi:hypothetical protein
MANLRLLVIVGIPIVMGSLLITLALYFFYPSKFETCCPCAIQAKPLIQTIKVPVPVMVPIQINTNNMPPQYSVA